MRILARLVGTGAPELETKRLCDVCAEVTGMTGAGIMLMSGDVPRGPVCTTDTASAVVEQLQYELGEGPCVDAYDQDRPVLEPDLAEPRTARWLAFTGPAIAAGVRAIFGFPPRSARSASERSTCTATNRGRSATHGTPMPWSWPTSPPKPSW